MVVPQVKLLQVMLLIIAVDDRDVVDSVYPILVQHADRSKSFLQLLGSYTFFPFFVLPWSLSQTLSW